MRPESTESFVEGLLGKAVAPVDPLISKNILSLSGEYFVAAELSRWGCMASITYGSAKSVDIQVTNPANRRLAWIEAKTTQKVRDERTRKNGSVVPNRARWVVNATQLGDPVEGVAGESDGPGADYYVFVLLKPRTLEHPRYFIASRSEVLAMVKAQRDSYNDRRKLRGKDAFDGVGVPGVVLEQLVTSGCENAWIKIVRFLEAPK